ncbi:MAG: hypothetical protein ACHQ02_07000 [Candidatus Limnocylindrales bacterium]
MGATVIRGLVVVLGVLAALGGLVAIGVGGSTAIFGVYALVVGMVLIVVAFIERSRYRSGHAERTLDAPGPGGGEPTDQPMEPRFRRTDERFIDPTSHREMRVWLDPGTGERRYRAED